MAEEVPVRYHHKGGRECQLVNGEWRYGISDQYICFADHDDQAADDRGEFGMPTIGHAGLMRVMHESWGFENNTFSREFSDGKGLSLDMPSGDAKVIFNEILPGLLTLFLEKNRKYASVEEGYALGEQGIIPDLNRKLGIIIDRVWYGKEEVGEKTDEVVMDLIGHLLLFLAKRRRNSE